MRVYKVRARYVDLQRVVWSPAEQRMSRGSHTGASLEGVVLPNACGTARTRSGGGCCNVAPTQAESEMCSHTQALHNGMA